MMLTGSARTTLPGKVRCWRWTVVLEECRYRPAPPSRRPAPYPLPLSAAHFGEQPKRKKRLAAGRFLLHALSTRMAPSGLGRPAEAEFLRSSARPRVRLSPGAAAPTTTIHTSAHSGAARNRGRPAERAAFRHECRMPPSAQPKARMC